MTLNKAKPTFTDTLIAKHEFSVAEGAVIFDISAVHNHVLATNELLELEKCINRPPFDAMCMEWTMQDARALWFEHSKGNQVPPNGVYNIDYMMYLENIKTMSDPAIKALISQRMDDEYGNCTIYAALIVRDFFGSVSRSNNVSILAWDSDGYWLPQKSYVLVLEEGEQITEHLDIYTAIVMQSLSYMHQKVDVELVTLPRNARRRVARKLGKTPSPYFVIDVNPNKKRYAHGGTRTSKGGQLPVHTVRGHFKVMPDSHPLPQFAGRTFWVTSHTRGNKGDGDQKSYKVILD